MGTGAQPSRICDPQGGCAFLQVQLGTYRLTAQTPRFFDLVRENTQHSVNTPTTADLTFLKGGRMADHRVGGIGMAAPTLRIAYSAGSGFCSGCGGRNELASCRPFSSRHYGTLRNTA